jgi:hypothetical protein
MPARPLFFRFVRLLPLALAVLAAIPQTARCAPAAAPAA